MSEDNQFTKKRKIDEYTSIYHLDQSDQSKTNNELRRKQVLNSLIGMNLPFATPQKTLDFNSLYPSPINYQYYMNGLGQESSYFYLKTTKEEIENNKAKIDDIDMENSKDKKIKLIVYQANTTNIILEVDNDFDTICVTILALWYPREYFSSATTENIKIQIEGITEFDFDFIYNDDFGNTKRYRIDPKDIELIVAQQEGCSIDIAVRSFIKNNCDIVDAIMYLC